MRAGLRAAVDAQREADKLLRSTDVAELLRKAFQLTHKIDGANRAQPICDECGRGWPSHAQGGSRADCPGVPISPEKSLRAQRDLIVAELQRREAEAAELLQQARYHGADPGHSRSWGQRRRRLLDTLLAGRSS